MKKVFQKICVWISICSFVLSAAPVTIEKVTSTPSVTTGSEVDYSITIRNTTGRWIILTNITDNLPAGFTYVPGSTSGATSQDPSLNGNQATWGFFQFLLNNQTLSLNFKAQAPLIRGEYPNYVTCSGFLFDLTNEGPTASVQVTGPRLILNKSVDKTSSSPGDILTYTVNYLNAGDGEAGYVIIMEDIPNNTEFVSGSAAGAGMTITYSHDGGASYDNSDALPVTHIIFQRSASLIAGDSGSVSFKTVIK